MALLHTSTLPETQNRGFTMVEIAVVILIAGIVLAAAIALIIPIVQQAKLLETEEKLIKISEHLNAYAVQNFRLPCPAEPNSIVPTAGGENYGFEAGSTVTNTFIPAICPITEGIVPFNTLQLPEEMVTDGWGRHITYTVNPNFAQDTANGNPANVHPACRTRDWMFDAGVDITGDPIFRNRNPQKARFCCPDVSAGPDLIVNDEGIDATDPLDDQFVLSVDRNANAPTDGYSGPNLLMEPIDPNTGLPIPEGSAGYFEAPQVPPANERATALAYILISHGQNQLGAFLPTLGGRDPVLPPAGSVEAENTDGDNVFTDQQTFSLNVATFDDLIIWRTQDLIFAAEGESCATP